MFEAFEESELSKASKARLIQSTVLSSVCVTAEGCDSFGESEMLGE